MIHLGDITKISGYDAPPVDCIIGGSPCQDLSVAGKRAGLAGRRSGLFMEQIRIVKEMRDADRLRGRTGQFIRPRYMVWENVPGAFSSNHGEDFRAVLEETIRIAEPETPDVPLPSKGRWPLADAYYGDGWSVAYRVLDAQFWGVPQRRRRIALVADFGGQSAPEILFERNGLSWDTPEGAEAGQTAAGGIGQRPGETDTASGFGETGVGYWQCGIQTLRAEGENRPSRPSNVVVLNDQGGQVMDVSVEKTGTLRAQEHGHQPVVCAAGFKYHQGEKAGSIGFEQEKSPTLSTDHNPAVISFNTMVCTRDGEHEKRTTVGISEPDDPMFTLSSAHSHAVYCLQGNAVDRNVGQNGSGISQEPMFTLNATDRHAVYDARGNGNGETVPTITGDHENRVTDYTAIVAAVDCRNGVENAEVNGTLQAKSTGGSSLNLNNVVREAGTVRRLTPVECERLQGFPSGWTDIGDWTDEKGKVHKTSDAARYKALGNSIALPPWKWVLKRLCSLYERDATMGSLFDGIGGFSLLWERLNGSGTCLWASEIEPFCIAVTKKRLGGQP